MKTKTKKFSPAVFGLIIICFFLPFMQASCGGEKIMSITGVQLVTGMTFEQPIMYGENPETAKIDPEPLAIATLLCAIIGLLFSFIKKSKSAILPALSAGIGTITMLLLKTKIDNEAMREGGGMLEVEYLFGFWAILLLLIVAVGLNIYVFAGKKDA